MDRDKNINAVRARTIPWDVVVIGGGATGAGCALDAASRGLSVLLLEQHDFGKGTSSRSTKLIHGGVRYLRRATSLLLGIAEGTRPTPQRPARRAQAGVIIPCYGRLETHSMDWNEGL